MAWVWEPSLEAAGTLAAAAPSPGSILHQPEGAGCSSGQCGCQKDASQTKFQFCWLPHMGSIKLQLIWGVRIELAVGSLPYTGMIWIFRSVLVETGNYLDSQFVSPVWTWGKILTGIPFLWKASTKPKQTKSIPIFLWFCFWKGIKWDKINASFIEK